MSSNRYIILTDLFDFSGSERDLFLYPASNGPSMLSVLAQSTGLRSSGIRQKLTLLEKKGRIHTLRVKSFAKPVGSNDSLNRAGTGDSPGFSTAGTEMKMIRAAAVS